MNKLILFFCILLAFSCNNDNTATGNTEMPEQEKQLRELIAKNPDSVALRNKLIDYFAGNGDYASAIKENDILIKKYPGAPDAWDAKARLAFLNKDTVQAISAFKNAIAILPDPQFLISLGTLYAQTKNAAALSVADSLLKNNKDASTLQALFIKGLYYSYSGDKPKAISYFDSCLNMSYTFLDAYREKALALYDLGKYLDAIKVLELQLALSKTDEETYYWMGRCFEKLDKREEAIQNYQMALQIDPDYAEAKDALGKMGVVQ